MGIGIGNSDISDGRSGHLCVLKSIVRIIVKWWSGLKATHYNGHIIIKAIQYGIQAINKRQDERTRTNNCNTFSIKKKQRQKAQFFHTFSVQLETKMDKYNKNKLVLIKKINMQENWKQFTIMQLAGKWQRCHPQTMRAWRAKVRN